MSAWGVGGYIKELATVIKAGGAVTAEQADDALAPAFEGLFQRPPTAAEAGRYGVFFRNNVAKLGGPGAVEQLLTALLCNTELIHRVEIPAGPANRLAPRDLARAIAFALTDDGPDTALATAAAQGRRGVRGYAPSFASQAHLALSGWQPGTPSAPAFG